MNDDLISRSALLENLELLAKYQPAHKQSTILGVCATIRAAPAVDAAPKWISVEERLPDAGQNVLVVMRYKGSGGRRFVWHGRMNWLRGVQRTIMAWLSTGCHCRNCRKWMVTLRENL